MNERQFELFTRVMSFQNIYEMKYYWWDIFVVWFRKDLRTQIFDTAKRLLDVVSLENLMYFALYVGFVARVYCKRSGNTEMTTEIVAHATEYLRNDLKVIKFFQTC